MMTKNHDPDINVDNNDGEQVVNAPAGGNTTFAFRWNKAKSLNFSV
jgi:hypothetical protein